MSRQLYKEGLRRCKLCKTIMPLDKDNFYRSNGKSDVGFTRVCKACEYIRSKSRKTRCRVNDFVPGYIYVLECAGFYKIGCSRHNDIKKRIRTLQTGNPFIIRPLFIKKSGKDIFYMESSIHKKYNSKKSVGERYTLGDNDIEDIRLLIE